MWNLYKSIRSSIKLCLKWNCTTSDICKLIKLKSILFVALTHIQSNHILAHCKSKFDFDHHLFKSINQKHKQIYVIANDFSKKFYLGKTTQCLTDRLRDHVSAIRLGTNSCRLYTFYANQIEQINIIPLYVFGEISTFELDDIEKSLIKKHQTSLNMVHNTQHSNKTRSRCHALKRHRAAYEHKPNSETAWPYPCSVYAFRINQSKKCTITFYLQEIFSHAQLGKVVHVEKIKGLTDLTNWHTVKSKLRNNSISIVQSSKHSFDIVRNTNNVEPSQLRINLERIAKYKYGIASFLRKIDHEQLYLLKSKINLLDDSTKIERATKHINKHLKYRQLPTNMPNMLIKVPYNDYLSKSHVRLACQSTIASINASKEFKQLLYSHVKVVETKNKSIADMLHNHIKIAKQPERSTCMNHCDKVMSFEDFAHHDKMKKVLKQNSKNIPFQTRHHLEHQMQSQLHVVATQLSTFVKQPLQTAQLVFKAQRQKTNTTLSMEQVMEVKNSCKDLVMGPFDKNSGKTWIACQCVYAKFMHQHFIDNTNYKRTCPDFAELTRLYNRISRSTTNIRTIKLPYAYVLIKHKDWNKARPIVSYFHHPLRTTYKRAAKALNFIIKTTSMDSFNLNNMSDLKQHVHNANQHLSASHDNVAKLVSFDVKEMYTALQHQSIIKAVQWYFDRLNRLHRQCTITINKKTNVCRYGTPYDHETTMSFTLQQLFDVIQCDLNSCYLTVYQSIIMKQEVGIPMGSYLAPCMAIMTCNYYEHVFAHHNHPSFTFRGIRYIDDLLCIMIHKPHQHNEVLDFIENLKHNCYDRNLVLEQQPHNDGIEYLESKIQIDNHNIHIEPLRKNWQSVIEHGRQTHYSMQHWSSYSSRSTKIGVVIGTLVRMETYSNSIATLFLAILKLHTELQLLKYPPNIIRSSLYKLQFKSGVWLIVSKMWNMLHIEKYAKNTK